MTLRGVGFEVQRTDPDWPHTYRPKIQSSPDLPNPSLFLNKYEVSHGLVWSMIFGRCSADGHEETC